MKILLLSQWFDPEVCIKGLGFAHELQRHGHEVSVLTGFPNYPGGKVFAGYRIRPCQREMMDGVPVLRVALYPSHDRSAIRRMFNYVSFSVTAAIGIFTLPRPDIVYVYSPPPTVALAALLLRAVKGVPFVLDIQDMWPDTLGATGMVRQGFLVAGMERWLARVYRRAAWITVLSPGFKRLLIDRGVPPARITVIPNWTNETASASPALSSAEDGVFEIVYAGNLGPGQAMEVVIEAARLLRDTAPQVRFLIAGDGIDAAQLRANAAIQRLDSIVFLGRLPAEDMPALFAKARALLVHLRDEPIFAATIPSKTQAYLRAGKPILMGVRGDAADMVAAAGAGLPFEPGNPEALAETVLRMMALPDSARDAMGRSGALYYREKLSREAGTRTFVTVFEQVLADTESRL